MTTNSTALPHWPDFERDYIVSGVPHLFVVRTAPAAALFVDQGAARIGARFDAPGPRAEAPTAMLAEIHVEDVIGDNGRAVEIWTDNSGLFGNFYQLIREIVGAVVDEGVDPDLALATSVARWDSLLSRPSLMSDEAQAGLFGELWLLERLIGSMGAAAVETWVGPIPQPHDFRLGNIELEMKTTSGSRRAHMINGIGQLQPSMDCRLFLVSLKLANAGSGGRSLAESVAAIESLLAQAPAALTRFHAGLKANGYQAEDSQHYPKRRRLRDGAVLIEIADGVPRLTEEALAAIPARFAPDRIGRLGYAIDVEGMGVADGSEAFHAVIPPAFNSPETIDV
jgi:hypothetical protein